jgi:hypothetical protein
MPQFVEELERQRVAGNYPSFADRNRESYAVIFPVSREISLTVPNPLRSLPAARAAHLLLAPGHLVGVFDPSPHLSLAGLDLNE